MRNCVYAIRSALQESAKNTRREGVKIAVNATEDAEEQNTCYANGYGSARITVALESGNGILARIDVHRFHNEEIVVE